MKFEDIEEVWKCTAGQAGWEVDERRLSHQILKAHYRSLWNAKLRDMGDACFGALVFSYFSYQGYSIWVGQGAWGRGASLIITGILFLALGCYRFGWSILQKRSEERFESSLASQVDSLIWDLDCQIKLLQFSRWTLALLILFIVSFSYQIGLDEKNAFLGLGIGVALTAFAVLGSYRCHRFARVRLAPQRTRLQRIKESMSTNQ